MRGGLVHLISYRYCRANTTTPPHFQGSALSWPFSKATSAPLPPFQRAKACQGHRRPLCCQNIPQPSLASEMLSIFLHSSFSCLILLFFDRLEERPRRLVATHQPRRPYAQTPHLTDDETETQRRCKVTQARPPPHTHSHTAISTVTAGEFGSPIFSATISLHTHTLPTRVYMLVHTNRSSNHAELLPHEVALTFPLLCLCPSSSLCQKRPLDRNPSHPPPPGSLL